MLEHLRTPALLLDLHKLDANIERMRKHCASFGVPLRPHVKSAKCFEIVERVLRGGPSAITVSTLAEASSFLARGISDIFYAVGISPAKLPEVASIRAAGANLAILLDSVSAARTVAAFAKRQRQRLRVLIEIDSDGHRSGLVADDPKLRNVARLLIDSPYIELCGVLAHAGESYHCATTRAVAAVAARERQSLFDAAAALARIDIPCPVLSAGSTPSVLLSEDLSGLTEVRAGVYMFQDLVMAGVGVCDVADISLSVLVTVIGHQKTRGRVVTDGGWMALSRDRGTSAQKVDQGYGLVCDVTGKVIPDVVVVEANQEHGLLAMRNDSPLRAADFPIGRQLRVLPNHACATAAQHDCYHVVSEHLTILETWPRIRGW